LNPNLLSPGTREKQQAKIISTILKRAQAAVQLKGSNSQNLLQKQMLKIISKKDERALNCISTVSFWRLKKVKNVRVGCIWLKTNGTAIVPLDLHSAILFRRSKSFCCFAHMLYKDVGAIF